MRLWEPFSNFFCDILVVQFLLILISIMFINTLNSYKILLNLLLYIFFIGIYLSIMQLDVLVGFLWVLEITIIFCSTIILLYLNSDLSNKYSLLFNSYLKSFLFLSMFLILSQNIKNFNLNISQIFLTIDIWEDFYSSISLEYSNDLTALFYSFFYFNSISYVIIGTCLFICSLVLINLNKIQKSNNNFNSIDFSNTFNIFKDFIEFFYLRKQDLSKQNARNPSIKIFKKNDTKRNATNSSR